MFKRLLSVGGFTLLSRVTGFLRDILMASLLGKGALSDAFLVAFRFPNYFRAIFGEGTLNPAFLPRYAALKARGEDAAAAHFGDEVFSWQMAAQAVLLIAAMIWMPQVIRLIAPGFAAHQGQAQLATVLSRITFPYLILTVTSVQLSAMLNANEKFWAAAAWSNFLNLSMMATLLAARWFPSVAYAAAWGVLLGGVTQLAFITWAAARHGLWLRWTWPRWTPEMKEFFWAFGAVTLGTASTTIAPFIDTLIASFLPTGSLTALYYADRINQLPLGVLGIALGTVLLPEMSTRLAKGDHEGSHAAQNRAAALGLLLTLPFLAVFVAVPDTIMRALFAHGAFDRSAAALSAVVLTAYGVGLPAFVLVRIVASTFYARHDTATPVRATLTAFAVNIAFKVIFVWGFHFGIAGVALGTSLGAWVNVAILTWLSLGRGLLRIDTSFRRALLPILLAALAAGGGAYAGAMLGAEIAVPHTAHLWIVTLGAATLKDLAAFAAAGLIGGAAYGAVVLAFRRLLPLGRAARA
jgi:putative peptidoglycan lipid II flippase